MHRKRVTYQLHDSYLRLMTIKYAIPKTAEVTPYDGQLWGDIEWAIELLYNSVKTGSQLVGDQKSRREDAVKKNSTRQKGPSAPPIEQFGDQTSWRQDVVEKASTQQKGLPGLWLSNSGERERHNADGNKSGEVNVWQFCSVPTPSHSQTFQIKWEVLFTNPSARAGYDTRSIFKRSLTGFNSEFSFS